MKSGTIQSAQENPQPFEQENPQPFESVCAMNVESRVLQNQKIPLYQTFFCRQ